jgi:hypothetical protein
MRVLIEQASVPGFAIPRGAVELAWTYLLDEIFADAWEANLDELTVFLPGEGLAAAVRLRAGLIPDREGAMGRGIALLAPGPRPDPGAARTYRCRYGLFAPRALRSRSVRPDGEIRVRSTNIFTWRARLWGLCMRLGTALRTPALTDLAAVASRRSFVGGRGPSYCRLSVWTR